MRLQPSGDMASADKLYRCPSYAGTIRVAAVSFVWVVNGGGEPKWRLVAATTISLAFLHIFACLPF